MANALIELGVELDEINLGFTQLPYFDGMRAQAVDDIIRRLRVSDGIVFASTAQLYAPSAILQTFLEFLECADYRDTLADKHCMMLMVSKVGSERSAMDYLARCINSLGGFDTGRIGMQESNARSIQEGGETIPNSVRDIAEKTTEDFFRAVRQNRRYITPTDGVKRNGIATAPVTTAPMPMAAAPVSAPAPAPMPAAYQPPPAAPLYQQPYVPQPQPAPAAANPTFPLNLENYTERQEQDIKELTAMFAKKQSPAPAPAPAAAYQAPPAPPLQYQAPATPFAVPPPKTRTVKQQTQNLPHYYQPQMASGLTAVVQFSISGAESFEGYLTIVDSECEYTDGQAQNPEITIIADSNVWSDVLSGKHTAQKAFMIGGLKVRGNFVLLTRFDTLFKL